MTGAERSNGIGVAGGPIATTVCELAILRMTQSENLRHQADELVRLYGEMLRRLSHQGIKNVPELVAMHQLVHRAIEAIGHQELDWALAQIASLLEELGSVDARLTRLAEMKRTFSTGNRSG